MNRERLTHFHSSKTADVIFNDTGKIDHKLSLPLPVNLAIEENDRRENSVKVAEKVSERLHITFKVPTVNRADCRDDSYQCYRTDRVTSIIRRRWGLYREGNGKVDCRIC